MSDSYYSKAELYVLVFIFVACSLWVLDIRTLVPPDEGRYAEMAREMFASGDWITTRLNGIKYFEKPPLQTWMTAMSFALFGIGEWQARLWTGLCGILGVGFTGYAGTRVFGSRIGLQAGLVLGSSLYWVIGSQVNSLDMGLSGMMAVALCALLLAQRNDALPMQRRNWMLVCWAGMALSTLSKGLIGFVLPGAVLILYTLAARDWRIWTRLHIGKGMLLFFAISTPWFVLVGLKNPEQPHFFFIHEHFERFLLKEHHREAAWWVFFALLAAGSMPWFAVLPQSLFRAAHVDRGAGPFQPQLLLLIWIAFIVAFFTASNSKLPGYILPVFPAVALLIAQYLETSTPRCRQLNAGMLVLLGAGLFVLAPFVVTLAKRPGEAALYQACQGWIWMAGASAFIGGLAALYCDVYVKRSRAVVIMAFAGFITTQLLLAGFEPIGRVRAGTDLMAEIQAELRPDVTIYSVGLYEQSLTFYLGRPVILVDYTDEFAFGLKQQPALSIPSRTDFIERWRSDALSGKHDLAIVRDDFVEALKRHGAPLRIVSRDPRRTIIANFPASRAVGTH